MRQLLERGFCEKLNEDQHQAEMVACVDGSFVLPSGAAPPKASWALVVFIKIGGFYRFAGCRAGIVELSADHPMFLGSKRKDHQQHKRYGRRWAPPCMGNFPGLAAWRRMLSYSRQHVLHSGSPGPPKMFLQR